MTKDLKKQHQWGKISLQMQRRLQTAAIVCYMVVMFVQPAAAASTTDTIWTRFSTIMSDIYGELLGISTTLTVAVSAYQACHFIGMPECNVNLTHAVVYLSMAPKSNSLYKAYEDC